MDQKSVIKKVKKLELRTRTLVDGLIQGNYHSVFKGRGIEFNEVREYYPGDDIRIIDWNVTARMNEPYVKEFIEERDLTMYIVFDSSSSGNFGSEKQKKEASIELAASLIFAAIRNNDRVGLFLFTNTIEKFIPARKGKKHALKIIRELLYHKPKNKTTDLNSALKFASKIIKKKGIIFIISDFMCDDFSKPLRHLNKKNDVVAINMRDIREQEIPDVGYIMLEDEETGEQLLVDTSDEEFRNAYKKNSTLSAKNTNKTFLRTKTDVINIRSDEDYEIPLRKFFKYRRKMHR